MKAIKKSSSGRDIFVRIGRRDQRATVAVLVGMTAPMLAMAIALGIEVTGWTVTKQRLQRAADAAATAAAEAYVNGASAQTAATYGAYVAEINQVSGAATRSWNVGTSTLTDNMITIQMTSGVVNAADTAFLATVKSNVPLIFSGIALPGPTKTISTTAMAEMQPGAGTGGQVCLLTLQDYNSGTTTGYGITITGNTNLNTASCTVRSDDGITAQGSSTITTTAAYASGAIYLTGTSKITGTSYSSVAQIPDPYASNTTVQNGITYASTCTGSAYVVGNGNSGTMSPGCFSSVNISGSGKVTMAAGVYYVTGDIFVGGSTSLSGTGVTIFSNGLFCVSGASPVTLSAPASGNTTAGIVYASNSSSTGDSTCSGGTNVGGSGAGNYTGLFYVPKTGVTISGAATAGSSCFELIAKSVTITGSASLASSCSGYGLNPVYSLAGANTVGLVQ